MTTRFKNRRTAAVVLTALLVVGGAAACSSDSDSDSANSDEPTTGATSAEPIVSDVWARAATDLVAQDKSAVYLTIEGGGRPNALVAASVPADVATTVELHETVAATTDTAEGDMTTTTAIGGDGGTTGMMEMRPVEKVDIPADGQVELAPGGLHIMLIDLQRALQPGETIDVTLTFEQGDPMTVTATVREV